MLALVLIRRLLCLLLVLLLVLLVILVALQMLWCVVRWLASQLRAYRLSQFVQHWLACSHGLVEGLPKRICRLVGGRRRTVRRGCLLLLLLVAAIVRLLLLLVEALRRRVVLVLIWRYIRARGWHRWELRHAARLSNNKKRATALGRAEQEAPSGQPARCGRPRLLSPSDVRSAARNTSPSLGGCVSPQSRPMGKQANTR